MAPKSLVLALALAPLGAFSTQAAAVKGAAAEPWLWLESPAAASAADAARRPFAGDHRLLTTISPNGDGVRDRAAIPVTIPRAATVRLTIARTATRARAVYSRIYRLPAGRHFLRWAPDERTPPRTYLTLLEIRDARGSRRYGTRNGNPAARQQTRAIRVLEVEAAFRHESYRPGARASLHVSADATELTFQILRSGPERRETRRNDELNGVPVTSQATVDWRRRRHAPQELTVRLGSWASGLYFAKITTSDGRVGYAPFVLAPARLGEHRVAVVLPTNTWQAYNLRDDDGDGWGESWYVYQSQRSVGIGRPYMDRGVPLCFRRYDLPFLHWLAWNDRPVDYLAQSDLDRVHSAREFRRAYDLVIFPGHHEYVTALEYSLILQFRNLGGNLMFLSANNFFWRVDRHRGRLHRVALWRQLGQPEASLIGVQYRANNSGPRGAYTVTDVEATPWLWAGMGVGNGSRFGTFGIEIDQTAPSSPSETRVVARIPNLLGRGMTAEMTYYSRGGARVFAAGAFTLAGRATTPYGERLLNNLWRHMTRG
jgi:hypothetical protein